MKSEDMVNVLLGHTRIALTRTDDGRQRKPGFEPVDYAELRRLLFWPLLIAVMLWCLAWLQGLLLG